MQLILDGRSPVLVTMRREGEHRARVLEFHDQTETGTTRVTMAIVLGEALHPADYTAIGQAVMAVMS